MDTRKKKQCKGICTTMLLCFFVLAVIIVSICIYNKNLRSEIQKEIINTLSEVSGQSAISLDKQMTGEMNTLSDLADIIGRQPLKDMEAVVHNLMSVVERNGFKRMGIIQKDGMAYTTDRCTLYLGDQEYFRAGMEEGRAALSDTLTDKVDGEKINVYSAPLYCEGNFFGVLFADRETKEYQNTLSASAFHGKGYTYVIKRNGDAVVASSHPSSFKNFENVITSLLKASPYNRKGIPVLQETLSAGTSNCIRFINGVSKYMYCRPLNVNDWYLISVVPASVLDEKMNLMTHRTYIFCSVVLIFFLILILHIFKIQAQNKKELEKIAYIDKITGGYTYAKFQSEFGAQLKKSTGKTALVSIDIDKFKYLNDVFGYQEGNHAICFIWEVLNEAMTSGEMVAHRSADEFVMLINYTNKENLFLKLEDICRSVQKFTIRGKKHYDIVLSMGIYELENGILPVNSMVDRAEMAQKTVKGKHDIHYAFYDDKMRNRQLRDKEMENSMAKALERDEFIVYYQPKYSVAEKQVIGAEALVRWKMKNDEMISPAEFIPLFENNGFITKLDTYILIQVCERIREWIDSGIVPVPVSVNLSRLHLYNPEFVRNYQYIIERFSIPIHLVQLEVTESVVFENSKILKNVMSELHQAGFTILMDDFGTGYSSLHMLKNIPIDVLKLDKSFVDGIGDNKSEKIIISIIILAQSLDIKVTAEGVESEEQYEFLRSVHCDAIQGYYFSKPIPEEAFVSILKKETGKFP